MYTRPVTTLCSKEPGLKLPKWWHGASQSVFATAKLLAAKGMENCLSVSKSAWFYVLQIIIETIHSSVSTELSGEFNLGLTYHKYRFRYWKVIAHVVKQDSNLATNASHNPLLYAYRLLDLAIVANLPHTCTATQAPVAHCQVTLANQLWIFHNHMSRMSYAVRYSCWQAKTMSYS